MFNHLGTYEEVWWDAWRANYSIDSSGYRSDGTERILSDAWGISAIQGLQQTICSRFAPQAGTNLGDNISTVGRETDVLQGVRIDRAPALSRWTKISKQFIDPEVLKNALERFEEQDDFVVVLGVLSKPEIERLAKDTKALRANLAHADTTLRRLFGQASSPR